MRRRILWVVIGVALTSVVGGGAALSMPAVRHLVSGLWNLPDRLPALAGNAQVHYEPGAEDYARDVAALLPDAVTRIEAVHGRAFAHPATVGAYATMEAYASANGLGSPFRCSEAARRMGRPGRAAALDDRPIDIFLTDEGREHADSVADMGGNLGSGTRFVAPMPSLVPPEFDGAMEHIFTLPRSAAWTSTCMSTNRATPRREPGQHRRRREARLQGPHPGRPLLRLALQTDEFIQETMDACKDAGIES